MMHALYSLVVQAIIGWLTGDWWLGAITMSAFYISRETTQAEYRWIEQFGAGRRANMPWWGRFDLRVWPKLTQWTDWIGPIGATCAVALIVN